MNASKLTLGPLLFHWNAQKRRDFYFRIADEAPVESVYLGEVVCSKRSPFFAPYLDQVVERLEKGGKQVVLSSLSLVTLPREVSALREDAKKGLWIEANDIAAIQILSEGAETPPPFVVGPTINVLNEGAMDFLVAAGARRVVFASELTGASLRALAGRHEGIEKEVQVFGRQPLAVSMRCYHARAACRDKDHCRMACGADPDGLEVRTLTEQDVLAVSGTQTLSHGCLVLLEEMGDLCRAGLTHFRLSPQDTDMIAVARLYREVLDGRIDSDEARNALKGLVKFGDFINGFYHGREGLASVAIQK